MQVTTSPPAVDRQYAYSLYSPTQHRRRDTLVEQVEQPWLVFEAKDDEGRRVLWEKWLELREKWAGDSGRWM